MKQLATAIIGFLLASVFVANLGVSRSHELQNAGARSAAQQADVFYDNALASVEAQVASALQANPTHPIQSVEAYSSGHSTATATVMGDTVTTTKNNAIAANVNSTINERRIAINLVVQYDPARPSTTHRILLGAFTQPPFTRLISDTILSATTSLQVQQASDVGGCAGSGQGCDPNGTQAADPSTLSSAQRCTLGVGSGTCTQPTRPDSSFTASPWTDTQH